MKMRFMFSLFHFKGLVHRRGSTCFSEIVLKQNLLKRLFCTHQYNDIYMKRKKSLLKFFYNVKNCVFCLQIDLCAGFVLAYSARSDDQLHKMATNIFHMCFYLFRSKLSRNKSTRDAIRVLLFITIL